MLRLALFAASQLGPWMLLRLTKWHRHSDVIRAVTMLLAVSLVLVSALDLHAHATEGPHHHCLGEMHSQASTKHIDDESHHDTAGLGNQGEDDKSADHFKFSDCVHCFVFLTAANLQIDPPVQPRQQKIFITRSPHSQHPPRLERPPKSSA